MRCAAQVLAHADFYLLLIFMMRMEINALLYPGRWPVRATSRLSHRRRLAIPLTPLLRTHFPLRLPALCGVQYSHLE